MDNWIGNLIEQMGYAGIALLMFLENLFPPIPSELIMPLAGFEAAKDQGLNIYLVIAAGTVGSLAGALFWYAIGRWIDEDGFKRWVGRHGRWITLNRKEVDRVDRWFDRHGGWAVLIGRLVPTVRTLISIPAGLFEMPLRTFVPLTLLGTAIWSGVLGWLGYALGDNYTDVQNYLGPVSTAIIVLIVLMYLYRVVTFKPKPA